MEKSAKRAAVGRGGWVCVQMCVCVCVCGVCVCVYLFVSSCTFGFTSRHIGTCTTYFVPMQIYV